MILSTEFSELDILTPMVKYRVRGLNPVSDVISVIPSNRSDHPAYALHLTRIICDLSNPSDTVSPD